MAWTVITGTEDDIDSAMQTFEDDAGTSSIDSFSVSTHKDNQLVALVEYTSA